MLPTALADSIIGAVETGLDSIEGALQTTSRFEPATSSRLFRILGNDLAQMVFMPRLIRRLATIAPNVRLETVDASFDEGKVAMRDGLIDLAVGNWPAFGPDYFRQRLFSETFVVLMRRDHPLFRRKLTKENYLKGHHVDYRPGGATYSELRGILQKMLSKEGAVRHVTFTAGHALGLASIVAENDLLLTLPGRLAISISSGRPTLGTKQLPFPTPELTITQQWHARVNRDPAGIWVRREISELFAGNTPEA